MTHLICHSNDGAPLDKAAVQTQPTITVAGVNNSKCRACRAGNR